MRKKYLSALLFGALLFASAGTFTSCKDYDDDIENLQGQIDKVVSDLASLKSTIDNLNVGVTSVTFDEKTGELKVTTDGQSPVTYTIKTIVDVPVQEIKITVDGQDLKVNGEVVGKVGDTVKVEDGELTINGEGTGIKVGKYAVLENVADNKYTISLPDKDGNLQTIELLRAIPMDLQIVVGANYVFSQSSVTDNTEIGKGIFWGVATKDIDWKGPKGTVTKGQVLDGQGNTVTINVIPANTELDAQVLKLVDSEGNVAPVNVSASPAGQNIANSGSRATDKGGEWKLSVAFTSDVTENNASTVFATKVGANSYNKKYALSVNGTVLTDYEFIVDTRQTKTTADAHVWINEMKASGLNSSGKAPIGEDITLIYANEQIYDYQFYFPESEINDAEEWGIVLENNVLKAISDKAANKKIKVTARVLGVNGKVIEDVDKTIDVTFAPSTIEAIEIAPTTVKIDPTIDVATTGIDVIINMQDVFTSLTSAEAISLSTAKTTWSIDNDNFLLEKGALTNEVKYYLDAACSRDKEVGFDDTADNIKKIQYAKFKVTSINSVAKPGDYTLTLNLKDAGENEVKKVTVPVTVTIPTFDEIFEKSAAWNAAGEILTLRLDQTGNFMPMTAYKTSVINGTPTTTEKALTISFDKISNADVVSSGKITIKKNTDPFAILDAAIDNTAHKLKTLTAQSSYKVQGIAGFEVKSEKYTVNMISPLEGAQLVKYVDGAAAAIETTPGTKLTIDRLPMPTVQVSGEDKDGFGLILNGKDYVLGQASTDTQIAKVTRYSEENAASGWSDNLINTAIGYKYEFDSKAGNDASLSFEGGKLTIKDLAEPSIGTTEYTTTVKVKISDVTVGTNTVETVIEVPVTVKK